MKKKIGIILSIIMILLISSVFAMRGNHLIKTTREKNPPVNTEEKNLVVSQSPQKNKEESSKQNEEETKEENTETDSSNVQEVNKTNTDTNLKKDETKPTSNTSNQSTNNMTTKSTKTQPTKKQETTTTNTTITKTITNKRTTTQSKEDPLAEFYITPPTSSGYNKNLTESINSNLIDAYTGEKRTYFDSLIKDLALGIKSESEIKNILLSLKWEENTDVVSSGKSELNIIPETLIVEKFTDKTNNSAIILTKIGSNGWIKARNAYARVYIIYNANTKINTIAFMGIGFYYIDYGN